MHMLKLYHNGLSHWLRLQVSLYTLSDSVFGLLWVYGLTSSYQIRTHGSYSPHGCCAQVSSKSNKRFNRESSWKNPEHKKPPKKLEQTPARELPLTNFCQLTPALIIPMYFPFASSKNTFWRT